MAKIYSNSGILVSFIKSTDESRIPAPTSYDVIIEFDENTNPTVVTNLDTDWNNHSVNGTTLMYKNNPVTINADSSIISEYKQLAAFRNGLTSYYNLSSPTLAQTAQAVKIIIKLLALILDYWLKVK